MSHVCRTHWDELQTEAEFLKGKHVSQDIVIPIYSVTRLLLTHLESDLHEKFCKFGNIVLCAAISSSSVKAKCYSALCGTEAQNHDVCSVPQCTVTLEPSRKSSQNICEIKAHSCSLYRFLVTIKKIRILFDKSLI